MSWNGSATALHLEPRPSARLRGLLVSFHLLVAAGLLLALPLFPAIAGTAMLSLLLWLECDARRMPECITRDADGLWWLDGTAPLVLHTATFVTPRLVVLNLHGAGGVRRLALLADSLPPPQWRHLRVILRIEPGIG